MFTMHWTFALYRASRYTSCVIYAVRKTTTFNIRITLPVDFGQRHDESIVYGMQHVLNAYC